jgi:hypothetical protein
MLLSSHMIDPFPYFEFGNIMGVFVNGTVRGGVELHYSWKPSHSQKNFLKINLNFLIFYIKSIIFYYYSNKKITTKQNFSFFYIKYSFFFLILITSLRYHFTSKSYTISKHSPLIYTYLLSFIHIIFLHVMKTHVRC